MDYEIGDLLTLSDGKDYAVSVRKIIDGKLYLLLLEEPDLKSFKYVEAIDDENLKEITDPETIQWISKEFLQLKN